MEKRQDVAYLRRARALRLFGTVAVASLLGACATINVPMKKSDLAMLQRAPRVNAAVLGKQHFTIVTGSNALKNAVLQGVFGAVGVLAATNNAPELGAKLVRADAIPHTSLIMERDLVHKLAKRAALHNIVIDPQPLSSAKLEKLRSRYGHKGNILIVSGWYDQLRHDPWATSHYKFLYSARAKIVSLMTGKILWRHACGAIVPAKGSSYRDPTLAQAEAHNAAWVKTAITQAASVCAADLAAKFPAA